ncbi:MAG TPA: PilZ domain-containing protein [Allosphingosinicella sp.]|nr:PilZ domain-containing protein [Allosphingosinicella sp.]
MHDIRSNLVRGERRLPLASKAGSGRGGGSLAAIKVRREESRRCDQRREGRHPNVVDAAAITYQRRTHQVAVLNVSSRGAMIQCDALKPRIGARIEIRFADCNRTECFVRWVRDGRIGLEFGKETLVIGPAQVRELIVGGRRAGEQPTVEIKRERAPRQSLILRGELHWAGGSMPVRLRNISADGAMLEGSQDLEPGGAVVLELGGVAAVAGRVRWCRSRQLGIRFDEPFDLPSLAHPDEAPQGPAMVKPDYLRTEKDPDSPWAARWDKLTADNL